MISDVLGFNIRYIVGVLLCFVGDKGIQILIDGRQLGLCAAVCVLTNGSVYVNAVFLVDAATHNIRNFGFLEVAHGFNHLPENILLCLVELLVAATEVVAPCFLAGAVNLHHVPTVFSGHGAASLL